MAIDVRLCQKCWAGEYEPPEEDDDGTTRRYPSVTCQVAHGAVLLIDDDPPYECPYLLEQKLQTEHMTDEIAHQMSGRGPADDAEL